MPMVPKPVSDTRVAMGRLAIIVTVCAWLAYTVMWFFSDFFHPGYEGAVARTEEVLYLVIVTLLTVSALAYLLSRLGFMYRTRTHHRATRASLDQYFDARQPTLTTIIPSYQEEERVIMTTLLTAALQEYPGKRVVLLIDDPYVPKTPQAREQQGAARALPGKIERALAEPSRRFTAELQSFETAMQRGDQLGPNSMMALASAYGDAITWLENLADKQEITDHTDEFFVNEIVLRLADSFREVNTALLESSAEGVVLNAQMFRRLYRRLVWTFSVRISSFERKKYVSLSHEPNKAMNLNSYLGLMGGTYHEIQTVGGTALAPAQPGQGLHIPNPDYVVTLDADSVLLPEYCLRLVHLLEQQEYQDMAIAQTPYSAFPGSATRLERIAGATTDLQHIVHQGLTYYDATFWVGANAVIRKKALDQIAETSYIGDWEIKQYIKDRTVIEDTESTIDMGIHGWHLYNYPERLSYSATPPDFGSLCIQRRRWANGGLLILSKLHRQSRMRRSQGTRTRFAELFLRWNYMASISWSSASLLILLAFPFSATLISPLLGVIALPYFMAMASDLRYCGYKRLDVLRIYGFNLILLGVNLAGTLSSIVQGITASKAPFARTPKVKDRTVVPPFLLLAPYALIGLAGFTLYHAYVNHLTENACYAALNVILACYAAKAFIGLRNSVIDGWIHATSLLYRSAERRSRFLGLWRRPVEQPAPTDWRSVLQAGYAEPQYQTAGGGPGAHGVQGLAPPAPAPSLPDGPPRRRLSLARVLVALVVLAGAGYGGYVGLKTRLLVPPTTVQPDLVRALRRRHAHAHLPVPEHSRRPGPADRARLRGRGRQVGLRPELGRRLYPGPGRPAARRRRPHRPAAARRCTGHRLVRRQVQHQPGFRLRGGRRPDRGLPVGGQGLPPAGHRPGHRGRRPGRRGRRAAARRGDRGPGEVRSGTQRLADASRRAVRAPGRRPVGHQRDAERHVSIAGVNVMTMDFSAPPAPGTTMAKLAENALTATAGQLAVLYPAYGIRLRSQQIWQRLGATVMIGQNDIQGENFTVADASRWPASPAGPISAGSPCGRSTATASAGRPSLRPACCPIPAAERRSPACSSPRSSVSCRAARRLHPARARYSPRWRTPTRRTRPTPSGRRPPATRSATRSSRPARSTRPSGTTAATTRRRRCSTPGRRRGSYSARWCPVRA